MGLVVWLVTAIVERLNQTPTGRKVVAVVAALVIACVMTIYLLLINAIILTWLGL